MQGSEVYKARSYTLSFTLNSLYINSLFPYARYAGLYVCVYKKIYSKIRENKVQIF